MVRNLNHRLAGDAPVDWRWIWAPAIGFVFLATVLLLSQVLRTPAATEIAYVPMVDPTAPTRPQTSEPSHIDPIASRDNHDYTYPYPHP